MRLAPNIEMLEISSTGNTIHPVLLWDEQNLVLVDAGYPGQAEVIAQAIKSAGFSADRLTHLIFTHQDMDHIGSARELLALARGALALAHDDEAPYIDGRKTPAKLAAMLEKYDSLPPDRKDWCDRMKVGYKNHTVHIGRTLMHGDVLPICGGIEIVHTPGHTPGHICLLLGESGILVCGDALNISGGEITGPNPLHTLDMPLALESAEKARALPLRGLCTYHGGFAVVE